MTSTAPGRLPDDTCDRDPIWDREVETASYDQAVAAVEKLVRDLTLESLEDPEGPLSGARRIAEAHLRTWLDDSQMPDGPALATP